VAFTEIWTSLREVDLAVKRVAEWMEDESGVKDTILAFKMNSQLLVADLWGGSDCCAEVVSMLFYGLLRPESEETTQGSRTRQYIHPTFLLLS